MGLDESSVHISPATPVPPSKQRNKVLSSCVKTRARCLWHYGSNSSRKHKSVWHYSHNESSSQCRSRCDFNHISNRDRQCGADGSLTEQRQPAAGWKMLLQSWWGRCYCDGVGLQQNLQQQELQQMLQLPHSTGQPAFKMQKLFASEFLVVITCWMGTSAFTFTQQFLQITGAWQCMH